MSSGGPYKVYPYPVQGVIYDAPPWAADYVGNVGAIAYRANVEGHGGHDTGDESEYDDDAMDIDDDNDQAQGQDSVDVAMMDLQKPDALSSATGTEPGVATFGVELEFLLIQCPRVKMDDTGGLVTEDQHSNDPRWISTKMADWELDQIESLQDAKDFYTYEEENGTYCDYDEACDMRRSQYSRSKLTRVLRDSGLVVIKWPNKDINKGEEHARTVPIIDFSESEDSDDEREETYTNMSRLGDFYSVYDRDPSLSASENVSEALSSWEAGYLKYHEDNGLKLYRTRERDIKRLTSNRFGVRGWPSLSNASLLHLKGFLEQRLMSIRYEAKQRREDQRNEQADPLHVPVPGLKPQYKAWTVTLDLSVDGNGMTKERYQNTQSESPFDEYFWFGAEVVSPVLPMGDERSREAVRTACGALRNALRCHKPMQVSTGLHIHMGHTHGWTLYQAKRFATFWLLAERTILRLHRVDRDKDAKWCAKIRGSSRLWRALFSISDDERDDCAYTIQKHSPFKTMEYEVEMYAHLPIEGIGMAEKTFLHSLWQYDSITALHEGLGENGYCRTGIKWRIRGKQSSLEGETEKDGQPGTIEARIMHGTLDADHINNWVTVLERIVHIVRALPDHEFRDFLGGFVTCRTPDQLLRMLEVPDEIRQYWLDPKRRDAEDDFWEYPDRDVVDWNNPFMVPGHKATHGSYWD